VDQVEHIDDPATLKELLRVYAAENARLHQRLQELVHEVAELKGKGAQEQLELELARIQEKMSMLQRRLFGDSSERRRSEGAEDENRPAKKQRGHGPQPQPELRREQVLLELPEADRTCGGCQGPLQAIAGMTEDSEQITVIRREFVVQEVKRQKYRCRCGFGMHTAPAPVKHIPGGRYSLDFAIDVAINKYVDHLPLDRQRKRMARQKLFVETQTLWDQIDALAEVLRPVYDELREYILGFDVIGVDETWWRLMQKKATKKWWAWALTAHDACWFGIAPSRSAKTAAKFVGDFEGIVVCDGYRAYETLAGANSGVQLANCWSHVRRKFIEAEAHYPQCREALELIDELFRLERHTLDPAVLSGDFKLDMVEQKRKLREEAARPILDKLREWALEQRGLPKSLLRKAIDYMLGRWTALERFLDNPFVPIHNNRTERSLRGMVLGRKNHYGSRSRRGTQVAAIFYSLLDTATLNGLEPADYLHRAVTAAVEDKRVILPLALPSDYC
jgi:transposase